MYEKVNGCFKRCINYTEWMLNCPLKMRLKWHNHDAQQMFDENPIRFLIPSRCLMKGL